MRPALKERNGAFTEAATGAESAYMRFATESLGKVQKRTIPFVFNGLSFKQFDAPGSSQTAAFGVKGTIINGVNDKGDFVGFFSDGTQVNGFVQFQAAVGTQ